MNSSAASDPDSQRALDAARRAAQLDPTNPATHNNLGLALRRMGHHDAARAAFERALALRPDYARAHYNLGLVHADVHAHELAIACFAAAIHHQPGYVRALIARAAALSRIDRTSEAQQDYTVALAYEPGNERALQAQATLLGGAGRHAEAEPLLRRWLMFQPKAIEALFGLGVCLMAQKRLEEALRALREALALDPLHPRALANVVKLQGELCDWENWTQNLERLRQVGLSEDPAAGPAVTPSQATHLPFTAEQQLALANAQARELLARTRALRERLSFVHPPRAPERRLRVAYLSCDFRNHATGHLMRGMFALHDRERFEIFAYSYGPDDGSEYRRRIERDCEHFIDIRTDSSEQAARRIHAAGIDVLVDLVGYAGNGRPEIAALRPAPVRVNYLGFPATMGAGFMDYIIADAVIAPRGSEHLFAERVIRLPNSYQCTDRWQAIAPEAPPRSAEDLPETGVVFCCFNAHYKIEPEIFAAWMRILGRVPDSVLWLLQPENPARLAVTRLRGQAAQHGVEPGRLRFAPLRPKPMHLARSRYADLFLDTPMCNAHTTATDALWAGVPVLTVPGQTFATRVCASLLAAVGVPEMIVDSLPAYEERAVELATNPERLRSLRTRLERQRLTTPLFDTPGYVRDLESAFVSMTT